jgi:hypothetical protein
MILVLALSWFKIKYIMKATQYFFALLLPLALLTSCQKEGGTTANSETEKTPIVNTSNPGSPEVTSVTFEETNFNFGEIPKDVPVKHRFNFTNTGTADLLIESVKPTCQCTVTEYSKDVIKPGEKGFVDAEYNAKAVGVFKKSVTVTANIDPRNVILGFDGEVVE